LGPFPPGTRISPLSVLYGQRPLLVQPREAFSATIQPPFSSTITWFSRVQLSRYAPVPFFAACGIRGSAPFFRCIPLFDKRAVFLPSKTPFLVSLYFLRPFFSGLGKSLFLFFPPPRIPPPRAGAILAVFFSPRAPPSFP